MNKFQFRSFVSFVFCLIACFAILAPRMALAQDAGATQSAQPAPPDSAPPPVDSSGAGGASGGQSSRVIVSDAEVKQCTEDCMNWSQSCPTEAGLKKCQEEIRSCRERDEIWRVAYAKLVDACGGKYEKLVAPGNPKPAKPAPVVVDDDKGKKPPPPPPKLETPFVLCTGGAVKSKSGHGCECADGFPARVLDDNEGRGWKEAKCVFTAEDVRRLLVPLNKHLEGVCQPGKEDRAKDLQTACDETGFAVLELMAWYKRLVQMPKPLSREAWIAVWDKVHGLDDRLKGIENRLANLEAGQNKLCPEIPGKPEATMEERCAFAREQYLAKPAGPFKGGTELQILGGGNGTIRPDHGTDTASVLANINVIGWVSEQDGVGVGGIVGHGWNRDSNRLVTGARVFYIRALDKDRTVALRAGVKGTVEPATQGNEATNVMPELGLQFRPAKNFVCDAGVGLGGSKVVLYDGSRRAQLSGVGLAVDVGVSCGVSVQW